MRNQRILPLLVSLLLAGVPATVLPATANAASGTAVGAKATQSRLGRGFGGRSPSFGSRYRSRSPYRGYRRPFTARRFFGGALKALGVAYLFHMMFGWGAGGGSPFGLLLLAAIVLFFVTRRRRRRALYY
jgi:MYXO-CTERM domain-containing protein